MSGGSLEFCGNVGVRRIRLRDSWLGVGFNFRAIKRLWADPGFVDLGHRTVSFLAFLAQDIGYVDRIRFGAGRLFWGLYRVLGLIWKPLGYH